MKRSRSTILCTTHSLAAAIAVGLAAAPVWADDPDDVREELRQLRQLIKMQQEQLDRQQQIIESLQRTAPPQPPQPRRKVSETRADDAAPPPSPAPGADDAPTDPPAAPPVEDPADPAHTIRLGDNLTAGWDGGFFLKSEDDTFQLNIGGWVQPRYEFRSVSDGSDTSSFLMRRVRLDVRGHVFTPDLTFRVMPELARTATLRDAWINYAFDDKLQIRAGQFTVPFQWHRFVGPRRQHFAERGVPSETFGFPTGRDIGVMLHGAGDDRKWSYGAGFFDGAGRNVAISTSTGNMASARFTYAILGEVPREESDLAWSDEPNLSVGIGGQGAWNNEVRAWDLGRSAVGNERADWAAGTVGGHFSWKGFSLAADGYLRHVAPDDPDVGSYDGWAWMVSLGYFIVPKKYEVVGRYSELRLDSSASDTREREWGVGLNVYHRGHNWKTRFNVLHHEFAGRDETSVLVEHHIQF